MAQCRGKADRRRNAEEGQGPNLLRVAPKSSFTTLSTLSTTGHSCTGGDRGHWRDKRTACLGQETTVSLQNDWLCGAEAQSKEGCEDRWGGGHTGTQSLTRATLRSANDCWAGTVETAGATGARPRWLLSPCGRRSILPPQCGARGLWSEVPGVCHPKDSPHRALPLTGPCIVSTASRHFTQPRETTAQDLGPQLGSETKGPPAKVTVIGRQKRQG